MGQGSVQFQMGWIPMVAQMTSEFDAYASDYREHIERLVGFTGRSHRYFVETKVNHLLETLTSLGVVPKQMRMLDLGCGTGETDALLVPHVGELHGLDISAASIEVARQRPENASVRYATYPGGQLPYENDTFDAVFAITVLHHVPRGDWTQFCQEMTRVIKPGGFVILYEHNPFNPLTRWIVSRCEFDRDAVLLSARTAQGLYQTAGLCVEHVAHLLLFPWQGTWLRRLERALQSLSLGAQYTVIGRKPVFGNESRTASVQAQAEMSELLNVESCGT